MDIGTYAVLCLAMVIVAHYAYMWILYPEEMRE